MAAGRAVARGIVVLLLGAALAAVPSSPPAEAEEQATVEIAALQFTPSRLEIRTGTVVVWHNAEPVDYPIAGGTHEPAADDGSFAAPGIAPAARWSFRFLNPGTFAYRCRRHPIEGSIVVTGPAIRPPADRDVAIVERSADPEQWGFEPADATLDAGSAVVWRNNGSTEHTVTADDGSFDSGPIEAGSTWRLGFEKPGIYRYHCTPHPWMTGVVRVAPPGGPPPAETAPPRSRRAGTRRAVASPAARPASGGPARVTVEAVEPDQASPTEWGFQPPRVEIRAGDTIVWRNAGSSTHTATADDGSFDLALPPGATRERRFEAAGTYAYHCTPHPWMKATVIVTAAPASNEPSPASTPSASPRGTAETRVAGTRLTAPAGAVREPTVPVAVAVGIAMLTFGFGMIAATFLGWFRRLARNVKPAAGPH